MKIDIFITRLLLLSSILIIATNAHAYNIIRSGNWIIQVDTLVEKIPMNIQPKHYSQCLGQDTPIPNIPDAGHSCSITKHEINSDEVRWELRCQTNNENRTGKGHVKYNGNFLRGQLEMAIKHPSFKKPHRIQYRLTGRRTGPCRHP